MSETRFELTPQQVNFFETFGFLKLKGLFRREIRDITDGFESVFREHSHEIITTQYALHGNRRREIIMPFVAKNPYLNALLEDPRVVGIVRSLFAGEYDFNGSDGNLFYCESHWHADVFGAPLKKRTIKLSFYLDPLTKETGSIRFLPGSNFYLDAYAKAVRASMEDPLGKFGVSGEELPGHAVSSEPGDLILWNFRTLHASYHGADRRRLFSLNFAARDSA